MSTAERSTKVANVILAQLGGRRFAVMTGAKSFMTMAAQGLSFRLPRGAKDGINLIAIVLDPSDTYTIDFWKVRAQRMFLVRKVEGITVDALRATFTEATGLVTSLGTMGTPPADSTALTPAEEDSIRHANEQ